MITKRHPARFLLLVASFALCLLMASCGDDSSDSESDEPGQGTGTEATDGTSAPADSEGESEDDTAGGSEGQGGAGTATIDGTTYSFAPRICLPDDMGSSISGPGAADDGTEIYVDMAAGNVAIYLGTDDPMSADPDYVANAMAQGTLEESIDGSTVSVDASFTEHGGTEVVAEGTIETTC